MAQHGEIGAYRREGTKTTIMFAFADDEAAAAWFIEAREHGHIPERAGLRERDALDAGGRPDKGSFVVSAEAGGGKWLVEPLVFDETEADPEPSAA